MPLQLREYQKNDFIALKNIIRKTWRYDEFSSPKTASRLADVFLSSCLTNYTFSRVAVLNGKPVGIILVKDIARHTCPLPNRFRQLRAVLSLYLIIVGGGVIGCELAFIYRAFGSKVTVVEGQNRVLPLPSVDEEISRLLQREMKKKGIAVELARTVTATTPTGTGVSVEIGASPFVEVANPPAPRTLEADAVCVTVGRVPHTDGLGLDAAGVKVDARGWIEADDFLETSVPGVYAIGDVIGPRRIMLAHMAVAEAHTAVHNILHPEDRKAQRYDVVPSAIFTAPEIGDVGLSEAQAKQQGFAVKTSVFQFRELGKAQAMGELAGLFKLVVEEGSGKLLGAHIAGAHASDLIAEATLAIQRGCTARDLFETIHAHPTLSEGIYEAAGSLV